MQIMVPLSMSRLRAFAKCSVDYAKAFTTKITRRVSSKAFTPVYMLSNQSVAVRNGMFIEYHRFQECIQPNGRHQRRAGRSYKR